MPALPCQRPLYPFTNRLRVRLSGVSKSARLVPAIVVITHDFTANQIKIQITPDGEKQSKATITYRHSALAPEGNEEVGKLSPDWAAHQRVHWESAINSVLKKELRHD